MLGIAIAGGLGNQMFQYAFISAESLRRNAIFFLDKDGAPIPLYKYFQLRRNWFYTIDKFFFDHEGFKLIFSHYLRTGFYSVIKKIFIKQLISSPRGSDHPTELEKTYSSTFYNGFFQSPLYFRDYENEIRKYFKLKKSIIISYQQKFSFLNAKKKLVTIHIRKKDFLNLSSYNLGGADMSIPFAYYHNIIKKIHNIDNFYIFISDCPELLYDEFDYLKEKHISIDSEIIDFQHMLNADICIIANSTFSWWAAFLNKTKGNVVYCPKYFLGFKLKSEHPVGIYPEKWIEVLVEEEQII